MGCYPRDVRASEWVSSCNPTSGLGSPPFEDRQKTRCDGYQVQATWPVFALATY